MARVTRIVEGHYCSGCNVYYIEDEMIICPRESVIPTYVVVTRGDGVDTRHAMATIEMCMKEGGIPVEDMNAYRWDRA